ncbi:hypothetical protein [Streptomyces sp. NPDC089799]|uniref:hypothetical protein n=1 Tax=Streptomyces sp. NPDC089799 TaxID=3155066 RepID=UPI003443C0F6
MRSDLVPLLAPAPPEAVVTVEQQQEDWLRTSRQKGIVRLLNPLRLWKAAEAAVRGPLVWVEDPQSDGTVSWRSVHPRRGRM